MKDAPLLNLVLSVLLVISIGWLLYVGRGLLLPVFTAILIVYVMDSASEALRRLPLFRHLPETVLRFLVLILFTLVILLLAVVIADTVREISVVAPTYQANLEALLESVAGRFGLETQEVWDEVRAVTIDRLDIQGLILGALGGFTSVGGTIFFVIIYAAFLLTERQSFAAKVAAALQNPENSERVMAAVAEIDQKVSDYLAVKTLINVIIGAISFVILWLLDVNFALFWALSIALLNYIPYVGSYIAVAFPVILSLAQFGSIWMMLVVLGALTSAQIYVGNFLEPRMIGRQLNLSPFVVLLALSVWGSLWGVSGAILAVPLTSILVIILSSFDATRFLAVFLAERIDDPPAEDGA